MSDQCGACGENTVVDGGCVACGAGTSYRKRQHFGPKRYAAHSHQYEYSGLTYETGTKAARWICTAARNCPAFRIVEVDG